MKRVFGDKRMNPHHHNNTDELISMFIWSFKHGDNIIYNFDILYQLYEERQKISPSWRKDRFNKPIILTIVSIVECILSDFIARIQQHSNEKIPNLSNTKIQKIKYKTSKGVLELKKISKLTQFIDQIQTHDVFDSKTGRPYAAMHYFRKIRNRIHIQNAFSDGLGENEVSIFTNSNLKLSQSLLEYVINKMVFQYYRPQNINNVTGIDIKNFPFPWKIYP